MMATVVELPFNTQTLVQLSTARSHDGVGGHWGYEGTTLD